ncbi:hypothetical protein L3X38_026826 [Prunus dulcis]|uniref:Transposable element protein n=1 Tax=Prunus dulcis TaxID=3755 RepID=A0AAD4YZT1_PRUDU|nr:hypothetical protein L3X38_026826 [Prunus dulcis]
MQSNRLIRRSYSSPHLTCIKYPQTLEVLYKIHDSECGNHSGDQATHVHPEICNKVILDCLKRRLGGAKAKWVDELPRVAWAYHTTKGGLTGETPFSITYWTEAIIPSHVTVPSISLEVGNVDQKSEQMRLNLDLLEGEREKTIIRVSSYRLQLKSYYDKRVKIRQFQPGDLVLRKTFITTSRQGSKKINPNWKGPYVISWSGGRGSYTLDTMDGKEIPRQWNAYHL